MRHHEGIQGPVCGANTLSTSPKRIFRRLSLITCQKRRHNTQDLSALVGSWQLLTGGCEFLSGIPPLYVNLLAELILLRRDLIRNVRSLRTGPGPTIISDLQNLSKIVCTTIIPVFFHEQDIECSIMCLAFYFPPPFLGAYARQSYQFFS
jgi:hypothetical protein